MALSALLPLAACGADSPLAPAIEVPEAPVITALQIASVAATRATVVWSVDHPALGVVEYGTTEAYGQSAATGTSPNTDHEIVLDDLLPATIYHLRITVQDRAGMLSATRTGQFRTAKAEPVTVPVDSSAVRADPADVPVDTAVVPADSTGVPADSTEVPADSTEGPADSTEVPGDSTTVPADSTAVRGAGPSVLPVWMGGAEVAALPMAKTLVSARTGDARLRDGVVRAVDEIVSAAPYRGRALALGRELAAYVIAADLVELRRHDPRLDARFRAKLVELRSTHTSGAARD